MLRKSMVKQYTSHEDNHNTSADAVEQVERTAILLGQEAKQLVSDGTAKLRLTVGFNSAYRTAIVPETPQEQMKALAIKEKETQLKAEKSERVSSIADIKTRDSEALRLKESKSDIPTGRRERVATSVKTTGSKATPVERSKKAVQLKDFQKLQQNSTRAKQFTERISEAVAKMFATASKALSGILATGSGVLIVVLVPLMLLLGCAAFLFGGGSSAAPVSEEVNAYSALIQLYAREHGIPEYTELIKAVMMQESGGRGNDPMQASECGFNTQYPRAPNGITDPEYSVNVGIQNLAACIYQAKVESPMDIEGISLALQGYNYGNGYISWAVANYGGYSNLNAIEFSDMMASLLGWSGYGDKQYVPHVLCYYPIGRIYMGSETQAMVDVALTQLGNVGGEPYWSWYGYTERVEWCACFVSWCGEQCGYIEAGLMPKFDNCQFGAEWFISRGQWKAPGYEPRAGDIVFFDWNGDEICDHVGIVERCENGVVYTIEGNSGDKCVRNKYIANYNGIVGFTSII